jgi:hypothetical protein
MKKKFTILVVALLCLAATGESVRAQQNKKLSPSELQSDMRRLWEEHIAWTRNVILNVMDDLPGSGEAVSRLLQNQEHIGDAIKPFYGAAAGNQLTLLLQEHITIAAGLLTALKSDNTAAFTEANTLWGANADAIAAFLSGANPLWPQAEMKAMMHDHLALTAAEALARKGKDYAADIAAYDRVHQQALAMADMLADGLIRQFPSRFSGCPVAPVHNEMAIGATALLHQNTPNPFGDETVIRYDIPPAVRQAQLLIYDAMGNVVKKLEVHERGAGQLRLNTSGWKKGLYQYSLLADDKLAGTKTMMH